MESVGYESLVEVDTVVGEEVTSVTGDFCTAFEIDGVETEEDFMVWHNIRSFLDGGVWAFGVPCFQYRVIVLRVIVSVVRLKVIRATHLVHANRNVLTDDVTHGGRLLPHRLFKLFRLDAFFDHLLVELFLLCD